MWCHPWSRPPTLATSFDSRAKASLPAGVSGIDTALPSARTPVRSIASSSTAGAARTS
jgi:hypothetical protein